MAAQVEEAVVDADVARLEHLLEDPDDLELEGSRGAPPRRSLAHAISVAASARSSTLPFGACGSDSTCAKWLGIMGPASCFSRERLSSSALGARQSRSLSYFPSSAERTA